jgi:hypothetical protein
VGVSVPTVAVYGTEKGKRPLERTDVRRKYNFTKL